MITIPVALSHNPYDIVIASGGLADLGRALVERGLRGKALIVSNPGIWRHHGPVVETSLIQAGLSVANLLIPAGERYKTPHTLQKIYDAALAAGLERQSLMIALGGGVVGDMTGFAAATWLRGIHVVQVPTTLLAMVDAAIGGKTGINHPQGKNLIGAFHQPCLVAIDPSVLATLPRAEFVAAMAEVIKYGVIHDPSLFELLEATPRLDAYRSLDPKVLMQILEISARCKATVVAQDEREGGRRAILNYGHTVGHALESITHYRHYRHGEAVGVGMVAAGEIAANLGWWSTELAARQRQLIAKAGLPVIIPPELDPVAIATYTHSDKKVAAGKVRFILPRALGQVEVTDSVTDADVIQAVKSCQVIA